MPSMISSEEPSSGVSAAWGFSEERNRSSGDQLLEQKSYREKSAELDKEKRELQTGSRRIKEEGSK